MIAYTCYIYGGRVKRYAEALAERGGHVDLIGLPARRHVLGPGNLKGESVFFQPSCPVLR